MVPVAADGLTRVLPESRSERWMLAAVLAVALAVRLLLLVPAWGDPAALQQPDSDSYLTVARTFPTSVGLDPGPALEKSVRRTPGYPAFLAAADAVTGWGLSGVMLLQVLLSAVTVYLVASLGRQVASWRAGIVAAGFAALDPTVVIHSSLVLSDTLFAFLIVAGATVLVRMVRTPSPGWAAAGGALLAAATLTRPLALAVAALLIPVVWRASRGTDRRRRTVIVALFVVTALVPVALWTVRNAVVADVVTVSTIDGASLYHYKAAGAVAAAEERPFEEVQADLIAAERRVLGDDPTIAELHSYRRQRGVELLLEHPVGFLRSWASGAVQVVVGLDLGTVSDRLCPETGSCAWEGSLALAIEKLFLRAMVLAAAVGIVALLRRGRRLELLILIGIPAVLVVLSGGPEGYARFRLPVTPFLAVMAGAGITWSLSSWRTSREGRDR